jgi:hypothetical protein
LGFGSGSVTVAWLVFHLLTEMVCLDLTPSGVVTVSLDSPRKARQPATPV